MSPALSRGASALGCSLVLLACRRPPSPPEPGAEEYHQAVLLFAQTSDETKDLSYRDPRFEAVLAALRAVPPGGEPGQRAFELIARIRQAQATGDALDAESERAKARLESPPTFDPLPRDAPMPAAAAGRVPDQQTVAQARSDALSPGAATATVGRPPTPAQRLPAWYRAGSTLSPMVQDQSTPSPVAPSVADAPSPPPSAATPDPPAPTSTVRRARPPAPPSDAPPPVFGLPGPAGNAIQGRP